MNGTRRYSKKCRMQCRRLDLLTSFLLPVLGLGGEEFGSDMRNDTTLGNYNISYHKL